MKLIFTTRGTDWDAPMDPRFGRTEYLVSYDDEADLLEPHSNQEAKEEAHGAGPRTAQKLADLGGAVLITGNGPGGNAARVLEALDVAVFVGAGSMTLREAYQAYRAGRLQRA